MPTYEKPFGYVLIVVGVLILLFTFYEAYVLFNGFLQGSLLPAPNLSNATQLTLSMNGTNSTLEQTIIGQIGQGIASNILRAFPINIYLGFMLAIVILGVFASIGYKIAKLGIELNKALRDDRASSKN